MPTRIVRWLAWGGWLSLLVWENPLARGHRVRGLGRLWAWQIWRRRPGHGIEVTFSDGALMSLPRWSGLAGVVAATGSHEPAEQSFVHRLVRPGDGAIDVGANVGLFAARLAAEGVIVSAFEPNAKAREVLRDNLARNADESQWRIFPFALDDTAGSALMSGDLESSNFLLGAEPYVGAVEEVLVDQLDRVVDANSAWFSGHKTLFLKIDAEGRDAGVLRGAGQLLRDQRPIVLIETWGGQDEVQALLRNLDYRFYRFDLARNVLVEFDSSWDGQANLIGVPSSRRRQVSERLETSEHTLRPPAIHWLRNQPLSA